ncbi:hypothetical protein [Prevotella disiens]|uniref:hypothetical protein n=1 Tax=Prevotella disiens TaxID=28130 RepID=UPI0015837934|nr:hypothetical protein [Prevotella disiens]
MNKNCSIIRRLTLTIKIPKTLSTIKKAVRRKCRKRRIMRFQYEEIANANLEKEEQEELEQE